MTQQDRPIEPARAAGQPVLSDGRRAQLRPNRLQGWLIVATLACYAIGYPVALIGQWSFGWLLVALGGLGLLALGAVTIARLHRSAPAPDARQAGAGH